MESVTSSTAAIVSSRNTATTKGRWAQRPSGTDLPGSTCRGQVPDPGNVPVPNGGTIERLAENPLAKALLEGRFAEGDHISVDRDGDRLTFTKNT